MTIYQYRASLTTAAGSQSQATLNIRGGLCRQVFVRPGTTSTVFRVNITDESSLPVLNYDFHKGDLNDMPLACPMAGVYTVNITNASPNDTFSVLLAVEE